MDSIINVLQSIFRPHQSNAQNVKSKEYDGQALLAARRRVGTPGRVYVQNKMDEMGIKDRAYELELYNQYDKRKQTSGFYPWEAKSELDNVTPTPQVQEVAGVATGSTPVHEIPDNLESLIVKAAEMNGVPPEYLAALLARESAGFKPEYVGGYHTDGTGRGIAGIDKKWHPEVSDDQAFDPEFAVDWSAKYLKSLQKKANDDIYTGLRMYNGGQGYASKKPGYAGVPVEQRTREYADFITQNANEYKKKFNR